MKEILLAVGAVVSVIFGLLAPVWLGADWASGASTAGTVAAAWAAVWAIFEIRRDRRARNEPFVVFDIEASSKGVFWMVVENHGSGIARDVELDFEPVPVDYNGLEIDERAVLQHPIPMLAPGKRIRLFFHTNPFLYQRAVPRSFEVEVRYSGEAGFNDERVYKFDLDKRKGQTFPPATVSEELGELNKSIKTLVKTVKGHAPAGGGFLVEEWEAYQVRLEEQMEQARARDKEETEATD